MGVPDTIRSLVWPEFLKLHKIEVERYQKALTRIFNDKIPNAIDCPLLGGSLLRKHLFLTERGYVIALRILSIIRNEFSEIEYCPHLLPLVSLMLHHLSEDDTFGMIIQMLRTSIQVRWSFFPVNKEDTKAMNHVMDRLIKKHYPKTHNHIHRLNVTDKPLWGRWFCDMFIGILPSAHIFCILDSFLVEGSEVLLRFAMVLIQTKEMEILSADTWLHLVYVFRPGNIALTPDVFCKMAFEIKIKKSHVVKARAEFRNEDIYSGSLSDLAKLADNLRNPDDLPMKFKNESSILEEEDFVALWSWIPQRHRMLKLSLEFTTSRDGRSLRTFFEYMSQKEPSFFIIETDDDEVFGGYCSSAWKESSRFYGSGECFLFTIRPQRRKFFWTEANAFFMKSMKDITFGGGTGIAIWISDTLDSGVTDESSTFNNPPLTESKRFGIRVMEAYHLKLE